MKRTAISITALFLLGAIPCVANAFTAIAWSQSGQRGGSVKNAPTKEAAISAAIADCKKSGGGSDCQVFKVTDEPGFVALYATCAKTCGVTAVTGRPTAEQARADGKRECEAHYQASCQLAQEWEEAAPRTIALTLKEKMDRARTQEERERLFDEHYEAGGTIWETAEAMGLSREQAEKIRIREMELTEEWNRQHKGEREKVAAELQRRGIAKSKEEANLLAQKRENVVRQLDIHERLERE